MEIIARVSPDEAARLIEKEIDKTAVGKKVDEYSFLVGGEKCIVQVFEKFCVNTNSHSSITVVIRDDPAGCNVHAIGSGGGIGIFNFDWGASKESLRIVLNAFDRYCN